MFRYIYQARHDLYFIWVPVESTVSHLAPFKIKIKRLRHLFIQLYLVSLFFKSTDNLFLSSFLFCYLFFFIVGLSLFSFSFHILSLFLSSFYFSVIYIFSSFYLPVFSFSFLSSSFLYDRIKINDLKSILLIQLAFDNDVTSCMQNMETTNKKR